MPSTAPNSSTEQHSKPIEIASGHAHHQQGNDRRARRSSSVWSTNPPGLSPSTSPMSGTMSALQTPSSLSSTFPRGGNSPPSPKVAASTSPLSYFLSSSPSFARWPTSPGGGGGAVVGTNANGKDESAIVEDAEDATPISPLRGGHLRTSSMNWSNPDRAANVMRRLSLSGALGAATRPNVPHSESFPSAPPPSAVEPSQATFGSDVRVRTPTPRRASVGPGAAAAMTKTNRSSSTKDPVAHRGPSPMGERMLKGHFDGFGF